MLDPIFDPIERKGSASKINFLQRHDIKDFMVNKKGERNGDWFDFGRKVIQFETIKIKITKYQNKKFLEGSAPPLNPP